MTDNIVTAAFSGGRRTRTEHLWQYDYGQVLRITGLELPETFEVHFSNTRDRGSAKTSIGTAEAVSIPDEYLTSGADIYAWVFLHTGADDGETEYMIIIPVRRRAKPSDDAPTPQEQSAITQAIAALNGAVEKAEQAATEAAETVEVVDELIDNALQEAKDSGEFDGPQGPQGIQGETGPQGPSGYSPTASVQKSGTTATITITDQNGTTTAQIADGSNYVLTNQDKSDIADIVAAEIGTADTMEF